MNYQDVTKDELIKELQKLRQEHSSLKASYSKDITGRKLAEEALQKSNTKFMSLADKISGYIAYVNADTLQYEFVNGLFEKSFGIPQEKIIGSHIKDIIGETNYQFALKYINEVKSGKSISYENTFDLDSEKRWLQINYTPVFNDKGYVASIVMLGYDITEQKQAEEALQKSEKLLRIVITNAPISIFATNEKGIFILHEGKALEKTGMKPGENVGVSAYELFSELNVIEHDGKVTNGKSVLNRVLNGESLSGFTELNGVHFDNQFVPLRDINDQIIGLIGVATDVTTSKKVEEALKKSEARFKGIFDNSVVGISAAYPDGRIFLVNKAFAGMYGYDTPEDLLKQVSNARKVYATQEGRLKLLQALRKNGFIDGIEVEVVRRDGSHFFVLESARDIKDIDGTCLYSIGTHIDITERKKSEEKIHEASLYARNLIEASLDPLVTISINGKITDVNRATEEISGIKRENLIGTDFADYFTEPDKARKGCKTVFSKGEVKDYPLSILHKNGRIIDVLFNATLFKNEAGEVQGIFAAARDITERKKMEEDLRNSKKSLEKLNRHLLEVRENERSQIALNLHDDFGQRLTALNLDIAWLKSRMGVQSEPVRKKFEEMSLMINDSIESIREVSSFLRPEVLYDLGLVPAIGWQLKKFEKQSGIHCQYTFDPGDIKIDDSISLILYRILQEALTNIVRHSEATTTVVDIRLERNRIEMVIKDDGKGIDENEINSLKSMGIAGMMERVRSVSGRMSVKGKKGSGTIIKISIPLKISKNNDQRTYNR